MMFEVYVKEVKIGDDVYRLKPLGGDYLPLLYDVVTNLKQDKDGNIDIESLNGDMMGNLHKVCLATFVKSYPNEDKGKLDEFVTQNLMKLIAPIFELNIGKEE